MALESHLKVQKKFQESATSILKQDSQHMCLSDLASLCHCREENPFLAPIWWQPHEVSVHKYYSWHQTS